MIKPLVIVILMAFVTYIPRVLPMVLLKNVKLPAFIKTFLEFIPYAALGALIFPGILDSTGDRISAVVGGVLSLVLAYLEMNITIVVFGGILGVVLFQLLT